MDERLECSGGFPRFDGNLLEAALPPQVAVRRPISLGIPLALRVPRRIDGSADGAGGRDFPGGPF
jgi:hypothetical protein